MNLPLAGLAGLAVLAAGTARADVEVQSVGTRLHVNATAAPLSRILQGIARETGAKVVYEGPQPRALVSVKLRDRSPVDAVVGLLEGLGVSYVLQADRTGTQVRTLLVVSGSAAGGSLGASAVAGADVVSGELPATPAGFPWPAVTRAAPPPPDERDDEDDDLDDEDEEEDDDMDDDEDEVEGAPAATPAGAPSGAPSSPALSGWPTPVLPDSGRPRLVAPPGAGVAPAPKPSPAPGSDLER